ncbi:unnamed protein product [Meganyctiphanes norvegica]|uniref:Major facilitator superfamily (MFS) profile domain-containing protein n=1 Tax=Meganyctiphanes norvegica TaxID=48144 RepID=A0AAV2QES3_MEGNR
MPFFSLGGSFLNAPVDHWCAAPEHNPSHLHNLPRADQEGLSARGAQCTHIHRNTSVLSGIDLATLGGDILTDGAMLMPCKRWNYDTTTFSTTVTMEWDLVCSRAWLSPLFVSAYFIGTIIGDPLMGTLADRFGRRLVLQWCSIVFVVASVTSALASQYPLVLAGRFILGLIHAAGCGVTYVRAMEMCPSQYHTVIGLLLLVPFAVAGMLLGGLAYFIREWRLLQLCATAPAALGLLMLPWVFESPRWLMLQGRVDEAAEVLHKAARWQKVADFPSKVDLTSMLTTMRKQATSQLSLNSRSSSSSSSGLFGDLISLVGNRTMRRITLPMFAVWFCIGFAFWGMSLGGSVFGDDPFLYIVLTAGMEVPGYTAFNPLISRVGRKVILGSNFAICAAAIFGILIVPQEYSFILAMVGKLFITGCYNIVYLQASELFPTCVRSTGLNLSSLCARLASLLASLTVALMSGVAWWVPSMVFGICSTAGCFFTLLLPESKGMPLTDTFAEHELLYGSDRSEDDSTYNSTIEDEEACNNVQTTQKYCV